MYQTFHLWFSLQIFVNLWKKNILFYGRFDHFSWTYEVAKFWMIKLCLDVIGIMHANEHTYLIVAHM